jgi:SpoVK/Ycf46/Vps4 family AAA+-type ATPase
MNRTVIEEAAVSSAKSCSHAEVEPRHVLFALARQFKDRPDCAGYYERCRRALDPSGSSYLPPKSSEAAKALLDTLKTDDDGVLALQKAMQAAGDAPAASASGSQTQSDSQSAAQPQTTTTTAAPKETVADVLAELDGLIGLGAVKAQVRRIIAVVQANAEREKAGLKAVQPGLHLVFTGPPGTGKTTVARLIARLYTAAGALSGSKFTEASRADLIAGYVGQTAIKTQEVIDKSKPGVLFIDEAYSLTPTSGVDYGHEAIATLVKAMEDYRNQFAVIVAGYEEEMQEFITSNPGLRSRFKTFIDFPDYSAAELAQIFEAMVAAVDIGLEEVAKLRAREIFARAAGREDFGNARFARSLFEQSYARMASRAASDGAVSVDELTTLKAEDIDEDPAKLVAERRRIGF